MAKTTKFLLGAILGAAAAALLTPVAGQQARSKLKTIARPALAGRTKSKRKK
jgi:gas vesicle protein